MTTLYRTYKDIKPEALGSVLAIGNFDGVHRGHRALITAAQKTADALAAPLSVMTFDPHPRHFFNPDAAPFRLTLMPQKQRMFAGLGVAHHLALPFDAALAEMPAEDFVRDILIDALQVRHIVVGEDFTFGHRRGGNTETLGRYAGQNAFGLTCVAPVHCEDGDVFSSTRIREHIAKAELDEAARLLGHPFEMEAPVIHGDKRGRTIGYPTANQRVDEYVRLPFGIYAVRVRVEDEPLWHDGAASFGIRPMFESPHPLLETYIFDFSEDIYGKALRVQPVKYLRDEMKFDSLETLKNRIRQDCMDAAAILQSTPPL